MIKRLDKKDIRKPVTKPAPVVVQTKRPTQLPAAPRKPVYHTVGIEEAYKGAGNC